MEIILIRHGKPRSASASKVNAKDYRDWITAYDNSDVADDSRPGTIAAELKEHYLISSDLKRAIHSCQIYTERLPDVISPLYREMDIPWYKLPLILKPMTWVYLCRGLWMLGLSGPFESYKQAKLRSEAATGELVNIAQHHGTLVLFGHGFSNLHIRKQLVARGWTVHCKSNDYWGVSRLSPPS